MVSATMQGSETGGHVADLVPEAVALLSGQALGSPEQVQSDLDVMMVEIRDFWRYEPDMVMRFCSAFSARLTELAVHLHRVENRDRRWKQVRTMQVRPLLEELDRQYKLSSRSLEVRRQDIELMR